MTRNLHQEAKNKAFALEAFDTLFNRRDFSAAERLLAPAYIQHSAHLPPGSEGLFGVVKAAPATMRYENALIVAEGDYVMLHGRFTNIGQPANRIVPTSCDSKRVVSAGTGKLYRTKQRRRGRRAESRCSEKTFPA